MSSLFLNGICRPFLFLSELSHDHAELVTGYSVLLLDTCVCPRQS